MSHIRQSASVIQEWCEAWEEKNSFRLDKRSVNRTLEKYIQDTSGTLTEEGEKEPLRILVPMCKKNPDLFHLYRMGFVVIGVENSEADCQALFTENDLSFEPPTPVGGGFTLYKTGDGMMRIYNGSIFEIMDGIIGGKVHLVWDLQSLVSLDPSHRTRYAAVLKNLVNDNFAYLLVAMEGALGSEAEVPFPLPYKEVQELFGDDFAVSVLEQQKFKSPGTEGELIRRNVLRLTRKVDGSDKLVLWNDRWSSGESSWHLSKVNEVLERNFDVLLGQANDADLTFFFPLCGKSIDMLWIHQKGYKVVGVDAVEQAVEEFFQENNIEYSREQLPQVQGSVFKSVKDEGRITIYCCDMFLVKPSIIGKVDRIFDRGSFVAIQKEDRKRYADLLLTLMSPKFRHLLNAFEYDSAQFSGPPYHVDQEEVGKCFGRKASEGGAGGIDVKVTLLESYPDATMASRFQLDSITVNNYLIEN